MATELFKAGRSAAECSFMIAQIQLNIQHLSPREQALFDQAFATLYHDLSVAAQNAAKLNSEIMITYSKSQQK